MRKSYRHTCPGCGERTDEWVTHYSAEMVGLAKLTEDGGIMTITDTAEESSEEGDLECNFCGAAVQIKNGVMVSAS